MLLRASRVRVRRPAAFVRTVDVNVKGKSPEGLGALGQGGGIAAQAVATIEEQ